ncbi:MAG: polyphosphate polymerase domain-containing protein [Lachnospiraceae bacterium]|nr:polyphosphate polymerase domain-containing protein [Lachnospiraceae bacterium]
MYRHEMKYLISERERDLIKERLMLTASLDRHATDGFYMIRSLYFDDAFKSAYEEKISGTATRRKYRIRTYNLSDSVISLECKEKQGSYILKRQAGLTREEAEAIICGDYGPLLRDPHPLKTEFYMRCMSDALRPEVFVDYERTPFVYEHGTVRITFDEHIRSAWTTYDLFDSGTPAFEVLPEGTLIMEIKYTEYLPEVFRDILPPAASSYVAASKYVLCQDRRFGIQAYPV